MVFVTFADGRRLVRGFIPAEKQEAPAKEPPAVKKSVPPNVPQTDKKR
jgi:hypothetical protein